MGWLRKSLFAQVMLALVLGCLVGVLSPEFGQKLQPLGDGFIKLIKMLIAPIVFCVVVHGIYSAGDLKKMGRVGVKTIVYFEVVTTVALLIGLALAHVFQPGAGMNIDVTQLDASGLAVYESRVHDIKTIPDYLLNIIPKTVFDAFGSGDILQVLLFAILFGVALSLVGKSTADPVVDFIEKISQIFFKIMGLVIKLAPLGVFGAIAFTTAKYGMNSLIQLGYLVGLFYLSCALFVTMILGSILKLVGFNLFQLIRYLREELLIVMGTASSDSVLPQVMRKLRFMGVKDSTVGLVIPTGYSFNLDGFSIYLTLGVLFIAQATNTSLSLHDLIMILVVSLLTSKGAHGIPGSAIVILAATLTVIPAIPAIGLVLLLSVDWFIGIARAVTNLLGNCVATLVIGAWEKDVDYVQAKQVLAHPERAAQASKQEMVAFDN